MTSRLHFFKRRYKNILFSLLLLCTIVITIPYTMPIFGSVFFGHPFYNLTLAKGFYKLSLFPKPREYSHYQLARIAFVQGDSKTTLIELEKEEALYPENSKIHYLRGLTYGYTGLYARGAEEFDLYIAQNPKTWAGRNDKAWLLLTTGKYVEALHTITPALFLYPDNPWVNNTYGVVMMNLGEYEIAKNAFLTAQKSANLYTEKEWGIAYPGNDPRIYGEGLDAMKKTISENIRLVEEKMASPGKIDERRITL
jgi:tetratricopeptide (TPR) repeat protein